jgi:formylmethanofuran dehydrogenase subunit E
MLNNFGLGWRNLFESHVEYVKTSMSQVNILSIERYNAMLRIKFETGDVHLQFILDCFAYKIERDSAKTCEHCGEYGFRRFGEWLQEPLCLCTPCYVKHVDSILSQQ